MPPDLPVVLLLPGQGAQQPAMAAGLYGREPAFTAAVDEVFAAFGDTGSRLREDWLSQSQLDSVADASRSQPLLFAVGYALGRMVLSWGVRPAALLGHSIGEIAAAVLANVVELPAAVELLRFRLNQLADAPRGGMLAVAAGEDEVAAHLVDGVVIGAVNGRRQVMLAGLAQPLAQVVQRLRAAGLTLREVPSTVPFHSPAMAYSVPAFRAAAEQVVLRPPRIPVFSGYTATILDAATATDPGFWAAHPVAPVLFWQALEALLATGDHLLVEAGPGRSLTTLARRHPAVASGRTRVAALLPLHAGDPDEDRAATTAVAGQLGVTAHP